MSSNSIRTCRYCNCKHASKKIDISVEEYRAVGSMYYHVDCFDQKENTGEVVKQRTPQERADVQLIKTLWENYISNTVVYSQLYKVLNGFIDKGISSDYLVFTMQYVIKNRLKLSYPFGFKYYVDNPSIKDAYKKKNQTRFDQSDFVAKNNDADSPKFSISQKPAGFKSILGGKK